MPVFRPVWGKIKFGSVAVGLTALAACSNFSAGRPAAGPKNSFAFKKADQAPIVYVRIEGGRTQLRILDPAGKREKILAQEPGYKCCPAWSRDHKALAYLRYASDHPASNSPASLVVLRRDSAGPREIVRGRNVDPHKLRLTWSLDNRRVYLVEHDFPTLMTGYSAATGKAEEIIRLPKSSFLTQIQTLSPDQKTLAGVGPAPNQPERLIHLGTIGRDGRNALDLMQYFGKVPLFVGTAVWSYDGQWLAVELDTVVLVISSTYSTHFRAYPLMSQEMMGQLTTPAFSPTGEWVVCVLEIRGEGQLGSGEEEVKSDLWLASRTGSVYRRLTENGASFDPAW